MDINRFVSNLSSFRKVDNIFNPWGEDCQFDRNCNSYIKRKARLKRHLNCKPRYLLIGEAPGYKGARYTGLPFVSEMLLFSGAIPRINHGGERITTRIYPFKEATATAVWTTLFEMDIADKVVLWNAFPWHLHKGQPHSNRTPNANELEYGLPFLEWLVSMYPGAKIIAVGKKAEQSIRRINCYADCVIRHPSMGGTNIFKKQMKDFLKATTQSSMETIKQNPMAAIQ